MNFGIAITPEMRALFPGYSDYDIARHYQTVATTQEAAMATKEPINQPLLGIDIATEGAIILRYINGEGQRVTLDLTAIIEEKVEAGVRAHVQALHGHSL